jgi:hypothetical protein
MTAACARDRSIDRARSTTGRRESEQREVLRTFPSSSERRVRNRWHRRCTAHASWPIGGREEHMRLRRVSVVAVVCGIALFAAACGDSTTAATTVSALSVTGTPPAVGATSQFKATATMADGSTQDVTSQASWSSTNAAVATVSSTGLVTGVASGPVTVAATYLTISASDSIAVP